MGIPQHNPELTYLLHVVGEDVIQVIQTCIGEDFTNWFYVDIYYNNLNQKILLQSPNKLIGDISQP